MWFVGEGRGIQAKCLCISSKFFAWRRHSNLGNINWDFDHVFGKISKCLNWLIYKSKALNFAFWKLWLNLMYNVYSKGFPFKYYISKQFWPKSWLSFSWFNVDKFFENFCLTSLGKIFFEALRAKQGDYTIMFASFLPSSEGRHISLINCFVWFQNY